MAKKYAPTPGKKVSVPATKTTKPTASPKVPQQTTGLPWMPVLVAMAITALCYLPSLSNGLVNWDDDQNITENANLLRVGIDQPWSTTIGNIFDLKKGNVIGNYNPLSILTFAFEKAAVGGEIGPAFHRLVHIDNLLLHLFVVFFATRILLLLGLNRWAAGLGGLLMGIHPMRVESVAWATERKDVLFAFFFFAAIECYIRYIQAAEGKRSKWIILCTILGIFSLFSKVQAVTLVVSLLLVDYLMRRDLSLKLILEKVPLGIVSFLIGLANVYTLRQAGSTDDSATGYGFLERFAIGSSSWVVYLYKLILPFPMSPLYPYPKPVPTAMYAAPIVFVGSLALLVWLFQRGYRAAAFAGGFFLVNVIFLLQFFGAGQGLMADRFTYVPYFGFFFLAAWAYDRYVNDGNRSFVNGLSAVVLALFAIATIRQIGIWKNGDTLWSHVIKYEGEDNSLPHWNRGQYRRTQAQQKRDLKGYNEALVDYSNAVRISPKDGNLYNSRGKTYFDLATGGLVPKSQADGYLQKALADYDFAVQNSTQKPKIHAEALVNRGAALGAAGRLEEAAIEITKAVQLDPTNKNAYFNRSIVYYQLQNFEKAIEDYSAYLELDPYNVNIRYERGMLRRSMKLNQEAIADLSRAIELDPKFWLAYLERARAYAQAGNKAAAQADYQIAQKNGQKTNQIDAELMK